MLNNYINNNWSLIAGLKKLLKWNDFSKMKFLLPFTRIQLSNPLAIILAVE